MPRLSVDLRKRILALAEEGRASRDIAALLQVGKSTVNDLRKKLEFGLTIEDSPRSGRPRKTTERVDRIIKRKSTQNVWKTATTIARELNDEGFANVSHMPASRRLRDMGLFGRIGAKKPYISAKNKKAQLEFAMEHRNWTIEKWKNVVFSDESKFNIFGNDGKAYVRRLKSSRMDSRYCLPTLKFGGGSIMAWGIFSSSRFGPLVLIEGRMDSQMYKEILQNHLLQYASTSMPQKWVFQQDNDPKHTSKLVREWFDSENIDVLKWPSQSPDLNPIEHLWEELKRRVRGHNSPKKDALFGMLKNEWQKIPSSVLRKLVESMPRRCAAVISAGGGPTKY